MIDSDQIAIKTDVPTEYRLPCMECNNVTRHRTLTSVERQGGDREYQFTEWYEVVQCNGCGALTFRKNQQNSEDWTVEDTSNQTIFDNHVELYPPRAVGRVGLSDEHFVPYEVRLVYTETHQALSCGLRILAGIGIRVIVEAVCQDKEAKGRSLDQKISDLVRLGVLTEDGARILHSLRSMGNKAAHEVKPHSPTTLNLAFDVIEHLLLGVYIIPAKAGGLES
jgi:hypothetical protein